MYRVALPFKVLYREGYDMRYIGTLILVIIDAFETRRRRPTVTTVARKAAFRRQKRWQLRGWHWGGGGYHWGVGTRSAGAYRGCRGILLKTLYGSIYCFLLIQTEAMLMKVAWMLHIICVQAA